MLYTPRSPNPIFIPDARLSIFRRLFTNVSRNARHKYPVVYQARFSKYSKVRRTGKNGSPSRGSSSAFSRFVCTSFIKGDSKKLPAGVARADGQRGGFNPPNVCPVHRLPCGWERAVKSERPENAICYAGRLLSAIKLASGILRPGNVLVAERRRGRRVGRRNHGILFISGSTPQNHATAETRRTQALVCTSTRRGSDARASAVKNTYTTSEKCQIAKMG